MMVRAFLLIVTRFRLILIKGGTDGTSVGATPDPYPNTEAARAATNAVRDLRLGVQHFVEEDLQSVTAQRTTDSNRNFRSGVTDQHTK